MEVYIKVSGKTVEDALMEASIQLGTTRDNIEYHVIEKETKGFLGIGARKALIEARRKTEDEDILSEVFSEKKPAPRKKAKKPEETAVKEKSEKPEKTEKKAEKAEKKELKKAEKNEQKAEKKADAAERRRSPEAEERREAKKAAKKQENDVPAKEAKEVKEEPAVQTDRAADRNPEFAEPKEKKEEPAEKTPRVPADPEEVLRRAKEFLEPLLKAMGVDAGISMNFEDGVLNVDFEGEDMGILIGKRGQTLDSIQYLTSLVVNKGKAAYVRVKMDTENYRERRKATLENLAKNMAFKVKKTRRPAYLEPMNPYERRIIHSALQDDPYVTTHSEGEEPLRKVVITLKKRERDDDLEQFESE